MSKPLWELILLVEGSPKSITRQQCKRKGLMLLRGIWRSSTGSISNEDDKYWVDKCYRFGSSYTETSYVEIRQMFSGKFQ